MAGECGGTSTAINEVPSAGNAQRVGMSATDVVDSRVCLLGENVKKDGAECVVVAERGRCLLATPGACT
ncbi:hypothetical protein MCETE7_00462 [Acidimicrobiia bacterium]